MNTRRRLTNRRPNFSRVIEHDGQTYNATIGLDYYGGRVSEVFLSAEKEGSGMSALLGDIAVVISVALQWGVPVEALAKSVGRVRIAPIKPEEIDAPDMSTTRPASAIGATLDALQDEQDRLPACEQESED